MSTIGTRSTDAPSTDTRSTGAASARPLPVAHGEALRPGVTLTRFEPGGARGPDDVVVNADVVGGLVWQDVWYLGSDDDEFRMCIPDIRQPANQIWPLHWHSDSMFIIVLDGSLQMGDWLMRPGDVLVTEPNVEYGPLVVGPKGCQLLEVFARNDKGGGYAPEYHDHPTLVGPGRLMYRPGIYTFGPTGVFIIAPRPPGSEHNEGNQSMKIDGTPGLTKGRMMGGQRWDLGAADDPDRGVALDTKLSPGEVVPAHQIDDWRWSMVMHGDLTLGDRHLIAGDIVITEPNFDVPETTAGPDGAHLLELCRTAAGAQARPIS